MKINLGNCDICGQPVFGLTGKNIPESMQGITQQVNCFVGSAQKDSPKQHFKCAGINPPFQIAPAKIRHQAT